MKKGDDMHLIHGFHMEREQEIDELKTRARLYRHARTGAALLSLITEDENKVFGITFRTPPADATGVAHILEHSVLCGSRKYPVKEPFVELLKGSLNTFLNAFTYPDKTCYPVASQNLKDFYNLIDVYLDAVFYPRLTPHVFQQEGWHFEATDPDRPLKFKGVVYNEMKGAYSSPDQVLMEKSRQSLFPDHPYGVDSGGNPRHIPELTFERFKAFHERYYHPSNARLYFYGDDDPDERLRLANDYLKDFDAIHPDSEIPPQPRFAAPRRAVHSFMVGEDPDGAPRGMVTLNWLLSETTDARTNFALQILEYLLLGMPASPLRKALIDSGLGEDLAGEGLGRELREIYFSTGLKGIDPTEADRLETLVMETLSTLVSKGIDPLTVEAAVNTIEFRLRENNSGHYPRGLLLMLRSLTTWLYGGDPLALLAFEKPLSAIRTRLASGPGLFEEMIREFFLRNRHRTTLVFRPDPALRAALAAEETERLDRARSRMDPGEIRDLVENTRTLKRLQETPDPPEALATIPVLGLDDLDRKNKVLPMTRLRLEGIPLLFHDLFTNGIVYLDLGFNLHLLPQKLLPYAPLFGRALLEMGTQKEDFVALTQRISRKTGGITARTLTAPARDDPRGAAWLFLRAKAMQHRTADLVSILKDVLLSARLDDRERFRQILLEAKARAEERLVPSGHQLVALRLRAHFGEAHWAAEQMGGVSHLFFLRELVRTVEDRWKEVLSDLEEIRRRLVTRGAMMVNVTLPEADLSEFEARCQPLLEALPDETAAEIPWDGVAPARCEGMTLPSQVNYVGKGADLYALGYRFHGSARVITRYLRNAWLWDQVRVRGGAYGAFCLFDRHSGVITFVSYRDPNLMDTLRAFDRAAAFLKEAPLGREEITKAVIGAIGDLDAPMLPDAKGFASLARYLCGDTDSARQRMREEILAARDSHFREFADVLARVKDAGIVKVLGSPAAIQAVSADRPGWLETLRVL